MRFGVEELPYRFHHVVADHGVHIVRNSELDRDETRLLLRNACEVVANLAPVLLQSVRHLLRSLHVISSPNPETDVSFSLPDLPNTIFVSIPKSGEKDAVA